MQNCLRLTYAAAGTGLLDLVSPTELGRIAQHALGLVDGQQRTVGRDVALLLDAGKHLGEKRDIGSRHH